MEELKPSAWCEACWPAGRMEMGVTTESKQYSDHNPHFILANYASTVKPSLKEIYDPEHMSNTEKIHLAYQDCE